MRLSNPFSGKIVAANSKKHASTYAVILILIIVAVSAFFTATKLADRDSQISQLQQQLDGKKVSLRVELQVRDCLLNKLDPDRYPFESLSSQPSAGFCFQVNGHLLAERPPSVPTVVDQIPNTSVICNEEAPLEASSPVPTDGDQDDDCSNIEEPPK